MIPDATNSTSISCACELTSDKTYAGTRLFVPPNTIAFREVLANFSSLADNSCVLVVLLVLLLLYILGALWARRQDVKDMYKV